MGETGEQLWVYGGLCATIAAASVARLLSTSHKNGKIKSGAGGAAGDEANNATNEDLQKFPGGHLTIYFGSQTGTAECYAQIVAAEGVVHGFKTSVVDLEDFSEENLLLGGKAIFIMASYGKGDPTDNAHTFYTWLEKKVGRLTSDHLASLNFTVFGMGNTQYEHYNLVGRTTFARLEKLGGQCFYAYGEGDDNTELEEDFESWKEKMWLALVEKFGGKAVVDGVQKAVDLPFTVKMLTNDEAITVAPTAESEAACSTRFHWHAVNGAVFVNRELRAEVSGVGSTRHIEIGLEETDISYHTADNLAILPLNDEVMADRLCAQLGFDPDSFFTLDHDDSHKPVFPTPCTVRDAFLRFMDITSIPRRSLLEQLTPYVVDETERGVMHLLSSKEGREEYHRDVEEPGWTLAELILERFSSLTMTLEHFLHVVPHLHPRYYTISSSSSVSPSRVHITVALLEQERSQGRVYRGVCSSFLGKLEPCHVDANKGLDGEKKVSEGPQCRVFVRESTFRLPADSSSPIIMIGPGTGVAPMRALLQERAWQKAQGSGVGRNVLYFGCRYRDQDYIYKDELEAYEADGTLDSLRLAFSREGPSKVYVQHLLRQDAKELWDLLERGAYVYVCGGTHMGTEVLNEMTHIAREHGPMRTEKAKEFMHDLENCGRYVKELWS